nr:MAG TPA: hypothetical protein [Caudoviricetes sp.]
MELKIDPEFRDKIPPLTETEFKQLEENIVRDREVREPLVIWNSTIIDGHHRWKVIAKHPEIPYKVKRMEFADKWAAIVWMCQNQLGKRNLTDEQKTYLIGKEYEAQKRSIGAVDGFRGNQHAKVVADQNDQLPTKTPTRTAVAKNHNISEYAVKNAVDFSHGLDAADKIAPGFKDSVLSGAIRAPKSHVASIAKLPEPEQKKAVEAIQNGKKIKIPAPKQPEPEPYLNEYTYDDLKLELDCVVGVFERNFKSTLDVHQSMIANEKGREKVIAALSEAEAAIKKIRSFIYE